MGRRKKRVVVVAAAGGGLPAFVFLVPLCLFAIPWLAEVAPLVTGRRGQHTRAYSQHGAHAHFRGDDLLPVGIIVLQWKTA